MSAWPSSRFLLLVTTPPAVAPGLEHDPTERAAAAFASGLACHWFVLAQTDPIDGQEYAAPAVPGRDRSRPLTALQVHEVPFSHLDGNAQGYSQPGRVLAINPVAAQPLHTTLHELGHIVLGHHDTHHDLPRPVMEVEAEAVAYLCAEALGLPGADESRGYIQHYLARGAQLDEPTARRIYKATDTILQTDDVLQ